MRGSVLIGVVIFLGAAASFCRAQSNPCESSPCQNGGVCHTIFNRFYCLCKSGYYGTYCSKQLTSQCKYMNKTYPSGLFKPKPCTQCLCLLGRVRNCTRLKSCNQTCGPCNGTCKMIGGVSTCLPSCPKGTPIFNCLIPPCQNAKCPNHPKGTCVNNYCGGCKADFYLKAVKLHCVSSTAKPPTTSSSSSKSGYCPRPNGTVSLPSCPTECRTDSSCMGRMKCCRSSCGGMHCACPNLLCRLYCPSGYVRDNYGCRMCACANKTQTICQKYSNPSIPLTPMGPNGVPLPGTYRPNCTRTGNFTKVQCYAKTFAPPLGCICVNPATGMPLIGWLVQKKTTGRLYCALKSKNLTICQYIQKNTPTQPPRRGRRSLPLPGTYHPTCTKTGNFTSVQCVQKTPVFNLSSCFCVRPVTGIAISSYVIKVSETGQKYCAPKGTTKPTCSPVRCRMLCHFGYQKDASGCQICKCNPAPTTVPPATCRPIACLIYCKYGYQKDARGCRLCKCNSAPATTAAPPATCKPIACLIFCRYGFKKDARGCNLCQCASAPTTCSPISCALFCPFGYIYDQNGCKTCHCKQAPTTSIPVTTAATTCAYQKKVYADGQNFSPSPCQHCMCRSGRVNCAIVECPPPSTLCPNPVRVPGMCCPICNKTPTTARTTAGKVTASRTTLAEITVKATTNMPSKEPVTSETFSVAFELQSTEAAIAAILTVERKSFYMYMTKEIANRYGLGDDNVQEMVVTETKSAVKVLIAFQLKPTAQHQQSEIIKVKQEISNDVDGNKLKFTFSTAEKQELEFESYAVDSMPDRDHQGSPDKNSNDSGLSTPAIAAIAVGAGLGIIALIVLIVLALRNGKGRRVPYDQNPTMSFDNSTYSLSNGMRAGNSVNPAFDQPLYDSDSQPILRE